MHSFHGGLGFLLIGVGQEREASRPVRHSIHHEMNCGSTQQKPNQKRSESNHQQLHHHIIIPRVISTFRKLAELIERFPEALLGCTERET